MKRTLIKDLKEGKCKVAGFVEHIRDKKSMQFVVLRDVSGAVQLTVIKEENPQIAQVISSISLHSFITVEGEYKKNEYVKLGGGELLPTSVVVESVAEPLPITAEASQDLRLDYRWIDLRDEKKFFMFQVQTAMEKYAFEYFTANDFIEIHTPKITGLSSEGGSEVFELKDYFGQKAYLTQSPQLYKQMAMMAGFDKVFEIGEYFRANPSFTNRHDTEFTGIDVEISHIENCEEVMKCEEELIKYIVSNLNKNYGERYKVLFGKEMPSISVESFPRITLSDAYKILKEEKNYVVPRSLKGDLDPEGERLICEYAKEKFGSDFVFITDFPIIARAFYTKKKESNPELGECYDLLYKGHEITSGAQREHRYAELRERIIENGINPDNMQEYLSFFKYGAPSHGGFGLGITRFLTKLFDLPTVKEITFLFRGPSRLYP